LPSTSSAQRDRHFGEPCPFAQACHLGAAHRPEALAQVWLFIVAPLIGAGVAGFLFKRGGALTAEDVVPERGKARSSVPPAAAAPTKKR
jgi:hypothetical protein